MSLLCLLCRLHGQAGRLIALPLLHAPHRMVAVRSGAAAAAETAKAGDFVKVDYTGTLVRACKLPCSCNDVCPHRAACLSYIYRYTYLNAYRGQFLSVSNAHLLSVYFIHSLNHPPEKHALGHWSHSVAHSCSRALPCAAL